MSDPALHGYLRLLVAKLERLTAALEDNTKAIEHVATALEASQPDITAWRRDQRG
jgi:hypothetical protein